MNVSDTMKLSGQEIDLATKLIFSFQASKLRISIRIILEMGSIWHGLTESLCLHWKS